MNENKKSSDVIDCQVYESEVSVETQQNTESVEDLNVGVSQKVELKKKKSIETYKTVLTCVISSFIGIFVITLVLLTFMYEVGNNMPNTPGSTLEQASFYDFIISVFPMIFNIILLVVYLFFIILINRFRVRRIFFAVGIVNVVSASLLTIFNFFVNDFVELFPIDWNNFFTRATSSFKGYSFLCSMILLLLGAVCLSIYFCVSNLKRGAQNE